MSKSPLFLDNEQMKASIWSSFDTKTYSSTLTSNLYFLRLLFLAFLGDFSSKDTKKDTFLGLDQSLSENVRTNSAATHVSIYINEKSSSKFASFLHIIVIA